MPMEMDPSVEETAQPIDNIKRLTQQARGRGRISAPHSYATRPTYSREPAPVPLRDNSSEVYRGARRGEADITTGFEGMDRGDHMVGPGELALGDEAYARGGPPHPSSWHEGDDASANMQGAYQKLLHQVALTHGGKLPPGSDVRAPYEGRPEGYNPLSDRQPDVSGRGDIPGAPAPGGSGGGFGAKPPGYMGFGDTGNHGAQAFQDLLHEIAIAHGGKPPSGEVGTSSSDRAGSPTPTPSGGPAHTPQVYRGGRAPETEAAKDAATGLRPPPQMPPRGSSKEAYDRHTQEVNQVHQENLFELAKARIEAGGPSKTKLEFASISAEHKAVTQDLQEAKDKLRAARAKGGAFFGDSDATKAAIEVAKLKVDDIQKLYDDVVNRRDKIVQEHLGKGVKVSDEDGEESTSEDSSGELQTIKSDDMESFQALKPGQKFVDENGKYWVKH